MEILNPNSILSFILAGSHARVGYLRGFNVFNRVQLYCVQIRFDILFVSYRQEK